MMVHHTAEQTYLLILRLLVDLNDPLHDRPSFRTRLEIARRGADAAALIGQRDEMLPIALASAKRMHQSGDDSAVAELLQAVAIRLRPLTSQA